MNKQDTRNNRVSLSVIHKSTTMTYQSQTLLDHIIIIQKKGNLGESDNHVQEEARDS